MKYQLVIQRPAVSLDDFDSMVQLENEIIGWLGDDSEVDGHDFGEDRANIFIHTDDPETMFARLTPLLENHEIKDFGAAYRHLNGSKYKILWPENSQDEFKL